MRRRRGFTLVELLVVIAVIAILVAILFPVFSRAIQKSKATLCSNSMVKISRSLFAYAYDNNGSLPSHPQNLAWTRLSTNEDLDSIYCPNSSALIGKGFGFNLGIDSMPEKKRESRAYFWDGKDLKPGFIAPSAGWWKPDWLEYRHRWRANICFLDGHIKPYAQPYQGFPETDIPASLF